MILLIEKSNSHKEIKIKLNYDLIKKITPNQGCQFLNIKKKMISIFKKLYFLILTQIEKRLSN